MKRERIKEWTGYISNRATEEIQSYLWFGWKYFVKKKIKQMDYFHSLNTDVGVYCNSVYEIFPADNYMFKVTNRNTRTGCEICSKLPIKTPEQRQ